MRVWDSEGKKKNFMEETKNHVELQKYLHSAFVRVCLGASPAADWSFSQSLRALESLGYFKIFPPRNSEESHFAVLVTQERKLPVTEPGPQNNVAEEI